MNAVTLYRLVRDEQPYEEYLRSYYSLLESKYPGVHIGTYKRVEPIVAARQLAEAFIQYKHPAVLLAKLRYLAFCSGVEL
jgi:hypothetical protein